MIAISIARQRVKELRRSKQTIATFNLLHIQLLARAPMNHYSPHTHL